ncbi:hypothetical protein BKA80DRAFT_264611 [Phyllosticta citrichinensis]
MSWSSMVVVGLGLHVRRCAVISPWWCFSSALPFPLLCFLLVRVSHSSCCTMFSAVSTHSAQSNRSPQSIAETRPDGKVDQSTN